MITLDAATGRPTYGKGKVGGKVAAPKGGRVIRESISKSVDVPRGASLPQIAKANAANANQVEFRRQLPSIQPERTIEAPRPTSIESGFPSNMDDKLTIEKLKRRIQEMEIETEGLKASLLLSEDSIKSYRAFIGNAPFLHSSLILHYTITPTHISTNT